MQQAAADIGVQTRSAQAFWERYFDFYDTLNRSIPYRRMIEKQADLLEPLAGCKVLDAGTGTGNAAVELLQRGSQVIGIDFCEAALRKCQLKVPQGDFRFGDLTRPLEFEPDSFDRVSCCCVLHVLNRPSQGFAVGEFLRVLKPGGLVAVCVFASGFRPWRVYLETLREQRKSTSLPGTVAFGIRYLLDTVRILYYVWQIKRREKSGHYHFFERADLSAVLEEAGFQNIRVESIFASQGWAAVASKGADDPRGAKP